MSKQDVTYSRTAEDLERKYNLGQIAQGGTGGDSGKISQALQELSDCKATISNMLRKINEIEKEIGGGSSNIVYLTEAEYDALPDSKYTDDVEYRITDAGIGETKASNVSYDNSNSGLEAINTQMAIDEINESLSQKLTQFTYSADNATKYLGSHLVEMVSALKPSSGSAYVTFTIHGLGGYAVGHCGIGADGTGYGMFSKLNGSVFSFNVISGVVSVFEITTTPLS